MLVRVVQEIREKARTEITHGVRYLSISLISALFTTGQGLPTHDTQGQMREAAMPHKRASHRSKKPRYHQGRYLVRRQCLGESARPSVRSAYKLSVTVIDRRFGKPKRSLKGFGMIVVTRSFRILSLCSLSSSTLLRCAHLEYKSSLISWRSPTLMLHFGDIFGLDSSTSKRRLISSTVLTTNDDSSESSQLESVDFKSLWLCPSTNASTEWKRLLKAVAD